jgi:type II secretory pathway pseudopilin PulG
MDRLKQHQSVKVHTSARAKRATVMIEVLVSAAIMSICVAATVSTLYFSHRTSTRAVWIGVAYNLARQKVEEVKQQGFYNVAEATTSAPVTEYYSAAMAKQGSNNSATQYIVTTSVVSDATKSGVSPTAPTDTAIRTVTVTVKTKLTGEVLCTMYTYLARSGI